MMRPHAPDQDFGLGRRDLHLRDEGDVGAEQIVGDLVGPHAHIGA